MLNDGKKGRHRGRPTPFGGGTINHRLDEPVDFGGRGKGLAPPLGEGRQGLGWCRSPGALSALVAWGLLGPAQWDPPWPGE